MIHEYWDLSTSKLQRYLEHRAFKWVTYLSTSPSTAAAADRLARGTNFKGEVADKVRHLANELFSKVYFSPVYGDASATAFERALKDASDGSSCPIDDPVVFISPETASTLISPGVKRTPRSSPG